MSGRFAVLSLLLLAIGPGPAALAQGVDAGTPEVLDGGAIESTDDAGTSTVGRADAPVVTAVTEPDAGPSLDLLALDSLVAEPDAGTSPHETSVFGRRDSEVPGSVHVVKSSDLERFERDDPHAVVRSVPGVYVREEDGFGLRPNIGLRGANSDRSKKVTLLEDGVLLGPAPYSAPAAYYLPLITRMQAVRVVKGPAAIMHGPQTVGGSIEFITRDVPLYKTVFLDLAGGEYLYGKAHGRFGFGDEHSGVLIEGVHLRNSGFKEIDGGGDTGFVRNEWMAKGRHKLSEHHVFAVKAGYSSEGSNETYVGLTDADAGRTPNRRYRASVFDRMEWTRTQVSLSHAFTLESLKVTSTVYRHDLERTWRKVNRFRGEALARVLASPQSPRNAIYYSLLTGQTDSSSAGEALMIGPNARTFVSQGLQSVASFELDTGPVHHRFEGGVRWHYDRAERRHTEDAYLMRGGEPVWAGEPTLTSVEDRDSTHAVALHVGDAITWERFAITPGVRAEFIRSRSQDRLRGTDDPGALNVLLPGIGAHAQIAEAVGAFAGVYRGFSPPPPGLGRTEPELSVNYEAGARFTPAGARLEAIGFFNDYSNLTNICTFSGGCVNEDLDRQFEAGRAYIYGAEVFATKTLRPLAATRVPVSLAYTFTRTQLRESFSSADPQFGNVEVGDELPYVPEHQLTANVGVDRERYGLHVAATYTGAMREIAGQGEPRDGELTDPLLTFDLSASVRPHPNVRVYLNVRNVFDTQVIVSRRPFGARTNAPRMIHAGVSYGF